MPQNTARAQASTRRTLEWLHHARGKLATAGVALLALLLAAHVVFGTNGMVAWGQKRAQHRELQKHIGELQKENMRVSERIEKLKTDPEAIEKEAREQLRYAKPGEVVYTMPEQRPQSSPDEAAKR
jgi:cell division protein FtsB